MTDTNKILVTDYHSMSNLSSNNLPSGLSFLVKKDSQPSQPDLYTCSSKPDTLWKPNYLPEGAKHEEFYRYPDSLYYPSGRLFPSWLQLALFTVAQENYLVILNNKNEGARYIPTISNLQFKGVDIKRVTEVYESTIFNSNDFTSGLNYVSHLYLEIMLTNGGVEEYEIEAAAWLPNYNQNLTYSIGALDKVVIAYTNKKAVTYDFLKASLSSIFKEDDLTDVDRIIFDNKLKLMAALVSGEANCLNQAITLSKTFANQCLPFGITLDSLRELPDTSSFIIY